MTKQVALIATAVMATLLALVAVWQFRIVVIYVLISLLVAATFRRIPKNESRRRFGMRVAVALRYAAGFVVAVALIYLVGRFLAADFQQLVENLSDETTWNLPEWFVKGTVQQSLSRWFPTPSQLFDAVISQRELVFSTALGITQGIGETLSAIIIIGILSFYWSLNQNHFERLWLSLLPADARKPARFIWRTIEQDLGAYTRSQLIQGALAVVLLGLGYWLLGSPFPALLAVTGAIAWMIPVVGGALATLPPLLIGLLTSTELGITTVLYTWLVLLFLEVWVEPRLFKLRWDNPVLTFVILLAMADALGVLGIIIAPIVSVVCQILWKFLVTDRVSASTGPRLVDLREQQSRLLTTIENMHGTAPPLVVSSMERLAVLLDKAEPILDGHEKDKTPEVFRPVSK